MYTQTISKYQRLKNITNFSEKLQDECIKQKNVLLNFINLADVRSQID